MSEPEYLERAGTRIAHRHRRGAEPTLVFLPGYASDMAGTKAMALDAWAARQGRALLRVDYAGCGESGGAFEDGTLESWRDDALALIDAMTEGPLVLVGSSMGGWLMLLAALARPERVVGLVGIAAAPDFTDWGFGAAQREAIEREGRLGEGPAALTAAFWRSGQANLLFGDEIAVDCPVRLLHGQRDQQVPHKIALRLAERLRSADVQTVLVKDGDHRLSRPQDIVLLIAAIEALLETL